MPELWECQQTLLHQEVSQENRARNIFEVQTANPEPTGEPRPAVSGRAQALSPSSPGAHRALPLRTPGVPQPTPAPSSPEAPARPSSHSGNELSLLSFLPQMFLKYLLYPERLDVFLTAIESMTAPRLHSTELAAHMVDVLAAEAHFPPRRVGTCCCHSSSPRASAPSLAPASAPRLAGRQQWGWQRGPAPVPSHSHACPPPGAQHREDDLPQPAFRQSRAGSQKPGQGPARAGQQTPEGDG